MAETAREADTQEREEEISNEQAQSHPGRPAGAGSQRPFKKFRKERRYNP